MSNKSKVLHVDALPRTCEQRVSCFVAPAYLPGGASTVARLFESRSGSPPDRVRVEATYIAAWRTSRGLVIDDGAPVAPTLILHGEIFGDPGPESDTTLRRMASRMAGEDVTAAARDLRGNFALFVLGRERISLITDRVGSRKVFHLDCMGGTWLDTDLDAFRDRAPDPAGVASLIINRHIAAGRTLRADVTCLARASVHSFDGLRCSAAEYWSYDFSNSDEPAFARDLADIRVELWRLLTQAIRRRTPGTGTVALSLSGGVDSRAILAGLIETGFPMNRVVAASYGQDLDDDAVVARELSAALDMPWTLVRGSEDLPRLLELNARHCGGQVFFYPRGLDGLREYIATLQQPVTTFVGDECYGWNNMQLATRDDVFRAGIGIRAPASVPAYYSYGAYSHRAIAETLQADIDGIDLRYQHVSSLHDLKDLLYLDQRLCHMLLPWREQHLGHCTRVANPHIDEDILDFMMRVPTGYRLDKRLFRETALQHFGGLPPIRFARAGGCSNGFLDDLFLRSHDEIDGDLASTSSALDQVLPPEVIRAGLAGMCAGISERRSAAPAAVARLQRRLRMLLTRARFARARRGRPQAGPDAADFMSIGPIQMATVLQLRQFLKAGR